MTKILNPLFIVKVSQQTDLTLCEYGKVNLCHTGCVCSGIVEQRSDVLGKIKTQHGWGEGREIQQAK